MINKAFIIIILINLNLLAISEADELAKMKKFVVKVHNLISPGLGNNSCVFNDEIIKYVQGHCGHFSKILVRELLKQGYESEIVSIETYNKRNHAMVQVQLKNGKYILLDALSNVVYKYSIEEILLNTKLSQDKYFQKRKIQSYSNLSFFNSIHKLQFIPYVGTFILKNISNVYVDDKLFFKIPNDVNSLFDYKYNSYAATRTNVSEKINVQVKFSKQNRLSSVVIFPYSNEDYPKKVELKYDGEIFYKNDFIKLKRSLIVINLEGNDYCQQLDFNFSDFQGQDRLLLRDIYIYGK